MFILSPSETHPNIPSHSTLITMMKVVKEDKMIEAVLEHLSKDFFPDEPVFRFFFNINISIIVSLISILTSSKLATQISPGLWELTCPTTQ